MSKTLSTTIATIGAFGVLVVAPGSATAAVRDCNPNTYSTSSPNALSAISSITSVRNMSCSAALKVVRKNARRAGSGAYRQGGSFRLGAFSCRNTLHDYELYLARCTSGARAFRINYGS